MRNFPFGVAGLGLCALLTAAAAAPIPDKTPQDAVVVTDAELRAMVAKPVDGRATGYVWQNDDNALLTSLRLVPGEVEVHATQADLFVVQEGHASVLLGGKVEGAKRQVGVGETRGGKIVGGFVREVGVGGVLWIPAGMPHLVTPIGTAPFRYVVVKLKQTPVQR